MRLRLVLGTLVLVAACALAPVAAPKGEQATALRVCGSSSCEEINGRDALAAPGLLIEFPDRPTALAPRAAPFLRLRVLPFGLPATFVPGAGVVRARSTWIRPAPRELAALRAAAAGIRPFPAPVIVSARVGGRTASAPRVYAQLYGDVDRVRTPPYEAIWAPRLPIELESASPSPWTDGNELAYVPSAGLVVRQGGEWVRPGPALKRHLERDAGLLQPRTEADGVSGWDVAAPLAVFAAVALAFLGASRARRRSRAPAW